VRRRLFEIASGRFHGTFERPTARQRREADLFLADLLGGPLPPSRALESDQFLAELAGDPSAGEYAEADDVTTDDVDLVVQVVPGPFDAVVRWPNNKAYFFTGTQYTRYDVGARRVESGYPKLISERWRGLFPGNIDAAVVWNNGKAYFFKGSQYVRYDIGADRADAGYPKPISVRWRGLFPDRIDAAINWGNGKAYFFKGNEYIRYDIRADRADTGYPKRISARWPGVFADGIDSAVNWGNGKAYFFKGSQYIRYDMRGDRADAGYPKPIGQRTVTPAQVTPGKKAYRTIQEVMSDPAAVRRQAVLASVADFFPAFNKYPSPDCEAKLKVGSDSLVLDQGPWLRSYVFNGCAVETSCTSVNPAVMTAPVCRNNSTKWSFNAGPAGEGGPNPSWVRCDKDHIPSVGDTYIVLNGWRAYYGHVGIVLHVPPNGNGLWVTADGGQGGKPQQLALLVPRWGLMGAVLPPGGKPKGSYREMKPDSNAGPFLSGATLADIDTSAPVPAQNDDVAGMIARLKFYVGPKPHSLSNPRRLEGYVNIDDSALTFDVDGQRATADVMNKCGLLQTKVNKVIAACLRGNIVGGKGS
jgi:Hemopexin